MLEYIGGVALVILIFYTGFRYIAHTEEQYDKLKADFEFYKENSSTFYKATYHLNLPNDRTEIRKAIREYAIKSHIKDEIESSLKREQKWIESQQKLIAQEKESDLFKFKNLLLFDKVFDSANEIFTIDELTNRFSKVYSDEDLSAEFVETMYHHKCIFFKGNQFTANLGLIRHPYKDKEIQFNDYKKLSEIDKSEWVK